MKSTGIVRRVDNLGRVVIPMEIRKIWGETERQAYEIFTEENKIMLRKYEPGCIFCGKLEDVFSVRGKNVCRNCAKAIE